MSTNNKISLNLLVYFSGIINKSNNNKNNK